MLAEAGDGPIQVTFDRDAFLPKPDLYVDDMPATFLNSQVLDVTEFEGDWQALADRVVKDHVQVRPPAR